MSAYKMFLPVMPNGTVMDMFPLRSAEAALVAAARFLPKAMGAAELRKSPALAPSCWRASGGGWGFSDELAVEMAKAFGYTATEVYLQSEAQAVKVLEALESAVEWMTQDGCDCGTDEPGSCGLCLCIAALAELDAAEKP